MEVQGRRDVSAFVVHEGGPNEPVREQTEIGATAGGQVVTRHAQRRGRHLQEAARIQLQPVRIPLAPRIAVAAPPDGKETRVVAVAFLDQDLQGPLEPGDDREAGRPESRDGFPDDLLEDSLGASHRLAKLFGSQARHPSMAPAM